MCTHTHNLEISEFIIPYILETRYLESYMGERNYMDIVIRHSETLEQLAYKTF